MPTITFEMQRDGEVYTKNHLQEMCQKNGHGLPKYALLHQDGPPNNPRFEVSVTVEWRGQELVETASAVGKKKKDVEKMAATKMIDRLMKVSTVCYVKYIADTLY